MTDTKKTDRKITVVKDKDGNERKVIEFRAETGNLKFIPKPLK